VAGTVTGLMYVFPMAGSAIYQPLAGAILDSSGNMGAGMSGADFTPLFMFYLASIVAGGVMAYCVRPRS
ncbi:MAG: hypothetical protein KKB57_11910, partial [Proteobacteria bacterium]|nr:hypothetical protein [Pseudomonadota bacterium]